MIKVKNLESLTAFLTRYAGEPAECTSVAEVHEIEKVAFYPQDYIGISYCTKSGKEGGIRIVPGDLDLDEWFEFYTL